MLPIKKNYLLTLIACLFMLQLPAQNYLYTTELFGIDGSMLSGAITAGSDDVSMTYYNPAAIHKVPSQLSISLIQPTFRRFGFTKFLEDVEADAVATNIDLKSALVSFKVNLGGVNLAFLRLTRSLLTDQFNVKVTSLEGGLSTTRFFNYEYSGDDDWYGIGTNFQLGPNLYLGVSQFLSIAGFTYNNVVLLDETENGNTNRYFNNVFEADYSNLSFVTKLGLMLDTDQHDLGITITTPTYARLNKGGQLYSTTSVINQGTVDLSNIIDNEISPFIKTAWELNLGYSVELNKKGKLWVNSSYHTAVSEYEMVNLEEIRPGYRWLNGSRAVWNTSLAYAHVVNEQLELSFGARTNQFAYENKPIAQGKHRNIIFDGNHVHFVLGSKLQFNRNTVLIGVDYGTIRNVPNIEDFGRLESAGVLSPNLTELKKTNLSILLTYGFIIDQLRRRSR